MGADRYITWGETPEWGEPTPEKLAAVARDFLGEGWRTEIKKHGKKGGCCVVVDSDFHSTFHLASERPEMGDPYADPDGDHATRGFEIYFDAHAPGRTRVTTRAHYCDAFTSALVRRYTEIIAKWWSGTVEWPG
jgi:hypothetical protein